ncbi:hypothetical protein pb186bvf_017953 [Paramecium bursaria]
MSKHCQKYYQRKYKKKLQIQFSDKNQQKNFTQVLQILIINICDQLQEDKISSQKLIIDDKLARRSLGTESLQRFQAQFYSNYFSEIFQNHFVIIMIKHLQESLQGYNSIDVYRLQIQRKKFMQKVKKIILIIADILMNQQEKVLKEMIFPFIFPSVRQIGLSWIIQKF